MSFRPTVRPIPDDPRPGVPDPRVLGLWQEARRNPRPEPRNLAELRASMGWPNHDLSPEVTTETASFAGRGGPVPVRIYRSPSAPGGGRPAVVYFHGGGFVGGSLGAVENQCRLLADRLGAVVVNVDYRLAPEHPFPAGLDDCWDVVTAVAAGAADLGVDPAWIAVAGDSAGANLAAACCLLDARRPVRALCAQLLVYPVVDQRLDPADHHPWSEGDYDIRAHHDLVRAAVNGLRTSAGFFTTHYLQGHDATDPLVSPLLADPALFPPTLVVTAEYDSLRVEGEAFAARLAAAGVAVRAVRYAGMEHSFFDKLGLHPQTAEAVGEMVSFLRSVAADRDSEARLNARLGFLAEVDKLKLVIRRNELADGSRRENTAEHSWHLVMFALTLAEHAAPGTDISHALKLCALHDLVEIDAGDTFFWDEKGYEDKEARERAAARRLFGTLPAPQGAEFEALWEEFEACQTPEAAYANAVDRLCPVLLNSRSGGRSWRENHISAEKVRAKMTNIAQASPALGRALEALITASVAQGYLSP